MRLSHKAVQEFREIYKREFGKQLSEAEAREIAERVMRVFAIVLRPLPSELASRGSNQAQDEPAGTDSH